MVLHIGLQYNIKKSVGIELSKERHKVALRLKEKYAPTNDKINFICKSFFDHDWSDATVIYIDNTMYDEKIGEKIYNLSPQGCLILYKRYLSKKCLPPNEQNILPDLVERSYHQKNLMWIIKK